MQWRFLRGKDNNAQNRRQANRETFNETQELRNTEAFATIQENFNLFQYQKVDYTQVEDPSATLIYQSRVPDPEGTMVDVYLDGRIDYRRGN